MCILWNITDKIFRSFSRIWFKCGNCSNEALTDNGKHIVVQTLRLYGQIFYIGVRPNDVLSGISKHLRDYIPPSLAKHILRCNDMFIDIIYRIRYIAIELLPEHQLSRIVCV